MSECKTLEIRRNGTIVPFNGPVGPTQQKARLVAWIFWNGRCAFCGRKAREYHHAGYRHEGHEYSFEWLPICRPCHIRQHGYQEPANDNKQLALNLEAS